SVLFSVSRTRTRLFGRCSMLSSDRCRGFPLMAAVVLALATAVASHVIDEFGSARAAFASVSKRGNVVGRVDQILDDTVLLRGAILTRGKVPLNAGDVFNTK